MFVIIVGCSPMGYHLAKRLSAADHEVILLEKNGALCQLIWDELGSLVMQGDGADLVDLRRAGAPRADVLVAATDRDETNLVSCQMAKHAFAVPRTVAVIRDSRHQTVFRVLGVDSVVNLANLVLDALEHTVAESRFNHLAHLHRPNSMLVCVTIPEDASAVGRRLSDLLPPQDGDEADLEESHLPRKAPTFVSVVVREGSPIPPTADLQLRAFDEVYAVTSTEDEAALYENLTGIW